MTPVPLLEVEHAGLLTSVQDLGRLGRQRDGVSVGGAMDPFSASAANLLAGNPRGAAVLEITLLGPVLRVLAPARIALCGGDLSARLGDAPLPLWKTIRVQAGQRLSFGRRRSGARAYLAVFGGFLDAERLGLPLSSGAVLSGIPPGLLPGERGLRPVDRPAHDLPATLRVLPGPHLSHFTDEGQAAFFSNLYTVSPQSNRQGYRLSGSAVTRTSSGDILSEPMPPGAVQVPPGGQPILLMANRQTTGGYPLIGVVISADIPRAAQLAPGDAVRFVPVSLADASNAAVNLERRLRLLELASGSGGRTPSDGH